jgi:hypothetical protein
MPKSGADQRVENAKKRVNLAKEAIRLSRAKRRGYLAEQSDETRAVAYVLLPRTRRHIGQLIRRQRKGVLQALKNYQEADGQDQPEIETRLNKQMGYLHGLIKSASDKGNRAKSGHKPQRKAKQITENQAGKRRRSLTLPSQFDIPSPDHVVMLARLLAVDTKRRPGESDESAVQKLRSLTKRALVRYVNNTQTMSANAAIGPSVTTTLAKDGSVIEAESLAGGSVSDPTADKMDGIIDPLDEDIAIAVEDLMPAIPAEDFGPTGVPAIVQLAQQAEQEALADAPTAMDEAIEDILRSEDPVPSTVATIAKVEEVPFYKNPMFIGGAVLAGAFGLWYLYSRRAES